MRNENGARYKVTTDVSATNVLNHDRNWKYCSLCPFSLTLSHCVQPSVLWDARGLHPPHFILLPHQYRITRYHSNMKILFKLSKLRFGVSQWNNNNGWHLHSASVRNTQPKPNLFLYSLGVSVTSRHGEGMWKEHFFFNVDMVKVTMVGFSVSPSTAIPHFSHLSGISLVGSI